jgi:tungstate transport system substrate-binding protein
MTVSPQKFPSVAINLRGAVAFADFLVSPATQQMIGSFGTDRFGEALFFPDAGKSEDELRP